MGIVSRTLFPTCGSMCICCPALRSRSRQPVKRYKKLLADIFPKSLDGPPDERKIAKLCEYALKNPFRIPRIAKYLEERCSRELRCEHVKYINVVAETYNRLLCMCKEQMAYFAVSLLNVVVELLENSKQDSVRILGCETLIRFIYCQTDGIYTHNIENMVCKVCVMARETREDHQRRCLKASALQCLSAMVWFMAKFSTILPGFDEIVNVTLDNYETNMHVEDGIEHSPSREMIRPRPEKKDPSILTREEIETPGVWVRICIQRLAELAKESSTMRLVMDPMFIYFDTGCHWVSLQGLAMMVLSDMFYMVETAGNSQLILSAVIRHLDHKNVSHDPQLKCYVIHVATALARQIRSGFVLTEIGFVSDICRNLRKSIQATIDSVGGKELNLNISLQHSIEDCLLEISKGIRDTRPLFDMMMVILEKLPSVGVVARATIGSLIIFSRTISLASVSWQSQQVFFPEALLVQLLKVMLHPDIETRAGAHRIFSALLLPVSNNTSNMESALASITSLHEKLHINNGNSINEAQKGRESSVCEDDTKQNLQLKGSPIIYNLSSIIDTMAAKTCFVMQFSEDQIGQLLSGFWVQTILPDNFPSNFEAIGCSFSLTLIALRLMYPKDSNIVGFFQLPLSLRNMCFSPSTGMLPPARKRSVIALATGMLMFAAKIFRIPRIIDLLESLADVDYYLGINNEFQVYTKSEMDARNYGSFTDNEDAASSLIKLHNKISESESMIVDILLQSLSTIIELDAEELAKHLSETFTPDDAFMFGPQSILDSSHIQMVSQSKQSLSFDEECQTNSPEEDDATSESSIARFIPKMPRSPSASQVISVGQLMESALEVAGQVAGSCVSNSPVTYTSMASQCESLGTGSKKLSSWLTHEPNPHDTSSHRAIPALMSKEESGGEVVRGGAMVLPPEPWLAVRLPPASPFDNFLRAARY